MGKRLYVGNLAFSVNEEGLENFFKENAVATEKVEVIRDIATGRPRGFGFVELQAGQDLNAAIEATNGKELSGRRLTVNEARERSRDSRERGGRSGGGRRGAGSHRF
ncbi:MAG TPA: RNA-binding protein [Acidobacteriota bacterium]|jgi:RNA recognition motif-containing protein